MCETGGKKVVEKEGRKNIEEMLDLRTEVTLDSFTLKNKRG